VLLLISLCKLRCNGCAVEEPAICVISDDDDNKENKDTHIKPDSTASGKTLQVHAANPEEYRNKTPGASPLHVLAVMAQSGDSARDVLAHMQEKRKRGESCHVCF